MVRKNGTVCHFSAAPPTSKVAGSKGSRVTRLGTEERITNILFITSVVADPGNWKGGFQTIEREARGVKSARSAQILGLRPLPVQ